MTEEQQKQWRRDYNKSYRAANKEHEREYYKEYYEAHKAKKREYHKEYYESNKEKWSECYSRRYEENKEAIARNNKQRRIDNYDHVMWTTAKVRAKKQNIPFDITVSDIVIPDLCPVLGVALVIGNGLHSDNSPSLDRVVPELGYVRGNICVISNRANRIKNNGTADEHKLIAQYIEEHSHE